MCVNEDSLRAEARRGKRKVLREERDELRAEARAIEEGCVEINSRSSGEGEYRRPGLSGTASVPEGIFDANCVERGESRK